MRGDCGGGVDASSGKVHKGTTDSPSLFQLIDERLSPGSSICQASAIEPLLTDDKDNFPPLPMKLSVQSTAPGRVFRDFCNTSYPQLPFDAGQVSSVAGCSREVNVDDSPLRRGDSWFLVL